MLKLRKITVLIAGITTAAALWLVIERGGLIAWTALVVGALLLAKIALRPSSLDLRISLGIAAVFLVAWFATRAYVIATWESGEVVELTVDTARGPHTARLWVLDIGTDTTIYYDAEPHVAAALLAGKPLRFSRAGQVSTRIPDAVPADAVAQDRANVILEAMAAKYGERNGAATIYFALLGRARDRVAVIADLDLPPSGAPLAAPPGLR